MSFYNTGLKFSCRECCYCCAGEPGFVFLEEKDVKAISDFLKIGEKEFIACYTRPVIYNNFTTLSLKEKSNNRCVFLTSKGCAIYPVRPIQCSTYPFWPHLMESLDAWKEEKAYCPGLDSGELHIKEEIETKLKLMKDRILIKL